MHTAPLYQLWYFDHLWTVKWWSQIQSILWLCQDHSEIIDALQNYISKPTYREIICTMCWRNYNASTTEKTKASYRIQTLRHVLVEEYLCWPLSIYFLWVCSLSLRQRELSWSCKELSTPTAQETGRTYWNQAPMLSTMYNRQLQFSNHTPSLHSSENVKSTH